MDALTQRLNDLERRLAALEESPPSTPAWGRINGVPTPPTFNGKLFPEVEPLVEQARETQSPGLATATGFHRISTDDTSRFFQWQLAPVRTDDLLGMDDARNVRVLTALANPIRLRMMKAILMQPGTAAALRERLGLTSTGQTYHALNALMNGGMIQQEMDGTFVAIGDKACSFLVLLLSLHGFTEGRYDPAFTGTGDEATAEPDVPETRD